MIKYENCPFHSDSNKRKCEYHKLKEIVKGIFGKQECLCAFNDSKKEKIAKNNC